MSGNLEANFTGMEKRYTSQELIMGFARFSNSDVLSTNEVTKHWLWHSLTICQHFVYNEQALTRDRIRKILLLEVVSPTFQSQEKISYEWLRINQEKHPEIRDLVEALVIFLEKTSVEGFKAGKSKRDYVNFGKNTLYVAGAAAVSCVFLPNILLVGGVFIALNVAGVVVSGIIRKKKTAQLEGSVKRKIIEIDKLNPNEKSEQIFTQIKAVNAAPFMKNAEVREAYNQLVVSSERFAKLYQKHGSDLNAFFTVESIWKNTMPSLLSKDVNDPEAVPYVLSVMSKMEYMVRSYIQDLMSLELNGLKVEEAFWSAKVAAEQEVVNINK